MRREENSEMSFVHTSLFLPFTMNQKYAFPFNFSFVEDVLKCIFNGVLYTDLKSQNTKSPQ